MHDEHDAGGSEKILEIGECSRSFAQLDRFSFISIYLMAWCGVNVRATSVAAVQCSVT
jgi:hypothetical protein